MTSLLAPTSGLGLRRTRTPIDLAALAVMLLLTALFAAAILAALHPTEGLAPLTAAVAGGL